MDFGRFCGHLLGHFFVFLNHFGAAAAEVENVVWTYDLLQINKICEFWGSFLGRPLGQHFGAFLAQFWDHFGVRMSKNGGPKSDGKNVPKKVMRGSASAASRGGGAPLKHYNIGAPGGH